MKLATTFKKKITSFPFIHCNEHCTMNNLVLFIVYYTVHCRTQYKICTEHFILYCTQHYLLFYTRKYTKASKWLAISLKLMNTLNTNVIMAGRTLNSVGFFFDNHASILEHLRIYMFLYKCLFSDYLVNISLTKKLQYNFSQYNF